MPDREPVGRFANPRTKWPASAPTPPPPFPPARSRATTRGEDARPCCASTSWGSPARSACCRSTIPSCSIERLRSRDTALRDFLDIFNHRMISLFYQAWEKYRFAIAYERDERDRVSQRLLDLIGLGSRPARPPAGVRPTRSCSTAACSACSRARPPRSSRFSRTTSRCRRKSSSSWARGTRRSRFAVQPRRGRGYSEQLGVGAVVGDEIWDQQSRVRIRLGPLSWRSTVTFCRAATRTSSLRALTRFFAGGEYDFEVQLILRREEVPLCELFRGRRKGCSSAGLRG